VERQKADYGVVPIENSLEGAVTHTLDRFIDFTHSPVTIHGEVEQPIHHCLIVHRRAKLKQVKRVYSHPQALAQCAQWLDSNLPSAERVETNSTAEAVSQIFNIMVSSHVNPLLSPTTMIAPVEQAAIAREELAKGKELRAIPISDDRENKTRFLILGLAEPKKGKKNKTAILFALKDRPGALYDALAPFKRDRINLTKIESRPSKKKAWEYYFFIDLEGYESELRVKRALERLGRQAVFLKVLGSYPVAK
jgi:chorismate mutase/prephenate dehydratase